MIGQRGLAAGDHELDGGGRAAQLDRHRHGDRRGRRLAVVLTRDDDREQQVASRVAAFQPRVGDPHLQVAGRRLREGQQLEPHRLRQLREGIAQAAPAPRLDRPVVGPLVGADPDLARSSGTRADVVVGRLQEPGDVGRRGGRAGGREVGEGPRIVELERRPRGIGEHDRVRRPQRGDRRGDLPTARVELRVGRLTVAGLHARAAVEDHDGRVGPAAAGEREPATGERAAHRQDHRGHGEHPQQHDQPVPQPRVAAGEGPGGEQKHHRPPVHGLEPPLVDEMDDERQAHQRQRDEHPGLEKRHRRAPWPEARPTRNRASACSTSSVVSTR